MSVQVEGKSFLTHLECAACGRQLEADRVWNLCPDCGKPLLARYNLEAAAREGFRPEVLAQRPGNMWRYREVLPVREAQYVFTLGEGYTPLLPMPRLGQKFGLPGLLVKDESANPTNSFKARGLCAAVSRAVELGVKEFSIPSAGNAAGALSAYAARAGARAHVFMPRDVPEPFVRECRLLGAEVELVDGLITDCARKAARGVQEQGWFDVSTLKEPYRLEGKKTMGYELFEQLGRLPDVIIYPTGGGTGLVGMWKAFQEMEALGWCDGRRPRMVSVQAEGCAPIVEAFRQGQVHARPWENARTLAAGLRVPAAIGDFLILEALRQSQGEAVAVSDEAILDMTGWLAREFGLLVSPESAATLAALEQLRSRGWIAPQEQVVLFLTGGAYKYFPTLTLD
ncbi:MAG: threonine synthase [Calditrichaeota bacterium]|nr:MAG: threonine synthase [Calditrichota bacterium]